MSHAAALFLSLTAGATGAVACKSGEDASGVASAAPSASAVPVDRLGPGELEPGVETAYGLVLPKRMRIVARFPDAVHAAGPIPPEDVANYVRARVAVSRVELGAARTIFPLSKIRGGNPNKTYQLEVVATGKRSTLLEVHDVTPRPKTEGLDEAERLERVGLTPEGKLLNPSELE